MRLLINGSSSGYRLEARIGCEKPYHVYENKSNGEARIGRVKLSKTGKTLYYGDQRFRSLKGKGFKSNYFDVVSNEEYWISGPKRNGEDRLYGERVPIEIDADAREEYWETFVNYQSEKGKHPLGRAL